MKWLKEKDALYRLIYEENVAYDDIGKMYGVTGGAIRKAAERLFLVLPNRRNINPSETFGKGVYRKSRKTAVCKNCGKEFIVYASSTNTYCSIKCESEHKHKLAYRDFCNGELKYMKANWSPKCFKKDILEEQDNKCAICGMPPLWNGKKLVFIADHIDGNAANNIRSNIRCICPNCDSQLDTYKSRNKNSARSYYRYHKCDTINKILI